MTARAVRVVLDTNVLLSVFVFRDSRLAAIGDLLAQHEWQALTNAPCLTEFERVSARPQFGLDESKHRQIMAEYSALATAVTAAPPADYQLPRCKDGEDQKFLELARDGDADWLITSDKALLVLNRRQRLGGRFRILTPAQALSDESAWLATGTREHSVE
jgi:putative PIN family toxin of toxin-antitoxin system